MKSILVFANGWVLVGELNGKDLKNASVIRVWGTTKGLGQLAMEGPTESTKLDLLGTVKIGKPLFIIEAKGWK